MPQRGTRAYVFDPLTFIECIAALTPHPRVRSGSTTGADPNQPPVAPDGGPRLRWADLLRRVFAVDALRCPRCGGCRHMFAAISDPAVIRRLLGHLGLPTELLPLAPAHEPPQPALVW